ncbi:MAG: radical SAM protein [Candidatus Aminicenantales bacterium]
MTPPLPVPPAPPRTVFIELTSHCNMHCAFCPSDLLRRGKRHQDDARIRGFLDRLHALGLRPPVLLNVLGEPLLNKRIDEYLDLLEREGHPVTLITNLTLLVDPAVRRRLLKHANLTLALSVQTATPESFALRGCPNMPFKRFFGLVDIVAEEKFRLGSGTRVEIHIASNYVVGHDPTIQSDRALRLWPNFADEKSERRWIEKTLDRLDAFARSVRRSYPAACAAEERRAAVLYKDHLGSRIAASRAALPPDFFRLKDDVFWGFMFLPNVFLVFKSFELWTRDEAFLRSVLPAGTFFYVEENPGPWACPMTESFGILSGGEYVLCCLDYEAEMGLGRMDDVAVASILGSEKRARIRADAMSEAVCRRCKGNLFIFDTGALPGPGQAVDKFGRGWWEHEPGLHGRGGRWTKGEAWAYVYVRIPARSVRLIYFSPFDDSVEFRLDVESYQADGRAFQTAASFSFRGRKGRSSDFDADFGFQPGGFYRLVLHSPTFMPDDELHNGDTRRLGLAVQAIELRI